MKFNRTVNRPSWRTALVALAAAAAMTLGGAAKADEAKTKTNNDPNIAFERYNLANGLEVILHQDTSVPLVAVDVWYHVGSGHEVPGKSGFAHLFEHMLFQGSKNVGMDRHFDILKTIGASGVNGTTNTDRTNYFEVVPSHQLSVALWLESDRMGHLLPLLTQESLDNQIEVVRNERRQRYDNVPYGRARLELYSALYPMNHPYRYLTIGKHEDLAGANLDDVKAFYKTWYVPANATLVVAGDFEVDEAKKSIERWFGAFPKSEKPKTVTPPFPLVKHARVEAKDEFAKLRMLTYAWHTPAFFAEGDTELDVLSSVLGDQGTGRLYKRLVHETQLAQSVAAYQGSQQFSSVFIVQVIVKSDADLAQVEKIIDEEIEKVRTTDVSQREFDRAVTNMESDFVWGLESFLARAETLQRYNHYVGNPDYITQDLDRMRNSNPAKVKAAAAKYLGRDTRVELLVSPATKGTK